jgi:hypothetical protein
MKKGLNKVNAEGHVYVGFDFVTASLSTMSSSGGQPRETPKKLPPTILMRCTILRLS